MKTFPLEINFFKEFFVRIFDLMAFFFWGQLVLRALGARRKVLAARALRRLALVYRSKIFLSKLMDNRHGMELSNVRVLFRT